MIKLKCLLPGLFCFLVFSPVFFLAAEGGVGPSASDESELDISDTILVLAEEDEFIAPSLTNLGFVSVVKTTAQHGAMPETADLLENVVGVNVTQYGGLGMFSFVSIRGSEANQVSYYLDGVPLNSANSSGFNLSALPMTFLQTIEVYRGWVPSFLGPASLGGAVNFTTSVEDKSTSGRLSLTYGSFETLQSTLSVQHAWSDMDLLFHGGFTQSAGNYRYLNDNGTLNNREDDHFVLRQNSEFSSLESLLSYRWHATEQTTLAAIASFTDQNNGLPGTGNIQTSAARFETSSGILHLKAEHTEFFHDSDFLRTHVYYLETHELFQDPEHEISLYSEENLTKTVKNGIDVIYSLPLTPNQTFSGTLGGNYELSQTRNKLRGPFPDQCIDRTRWTWFLSLDHELHLSTFPLMLRPSIRWDGLFNTDQGSSETDDFQAVEEGNDQWYWFSPQIAAKWTFNDYFLVKSSVGLYGRYPAMSELYGDRGTSVGNPGLKPETGINRDLGFMVQNSELRTTRFFLEYAFFVKDTQDLMVYVQNSQYTFKPENLGAARIQGHEVHTSLKAGDLLSLGLNYTWQDGRDRGSLPYYRDNHLPNRPEHELSSSLSLTIDPVSLCYSLIFQSHNYLDRANRKEVPDRLTHNASVRWDNVIHGFSLTLEIKNISDNRISDVAGYPLPGRSFYAAIAYSF